MNDEPSAAASAPLPTALRSSIPSPSGAENNVEAAAIDIAARKRQNREAFNRKRGELLDDVLRNLDLLVYAELSAIYYMDCYFFRFFLRAIVQLIFLTPKSGMLPEPPAHRPYIGAILGVNILCFLLHLFGGAPSASEATRGYLHGGLIMDFIGQKGPSSKLHLLLLDLLVTVLQIVHLSAHLLRLKLRDGSSLVTLVAQVSRQNIDAEERGVRRSIEVEEQGDVEMETLNPGGRAQDREDEGEANASDTAAFAPPTTTVRSDAHIFDAFNSGQIVVADLNLYRTIQEQLLAYRKGAHQEAIRAESQRLLGARFAGLRSLHWAR